MPGTIKVWSLAYDGENGFDVELFSDEEKFNAAHLACVKSLWDGSLLCEDVMPDNPLEAIVQLASTLGHAPLVNVRAFELEAPLDREGALAALMSAMQKTMPDLVLQIAQRWDSIKSGKPPVLPTLAVIVEGGMVQSVVSDFPGLIASVIERVVVIDYDAEGSEESDVSYVLQDNGEWSDAVVSDWSIDLAKIGLGNILDYTPCRICAKSADDGEGFDGMCGSCADQAEERGAKTAGLSAIAGMSHSQMTDNPRDDTFSDEELRERLRASITDWTAFCDEFKIDYTPEDPPREIYPTPPEFVRALCEDGGGDDRSAAAPQS